MGLTVAIIVLNLSAPAHPDLVERALASALLFAAALPAWLWLSGADDGLPLMVLFGMIYAAYFGLPLFLLNSYSLGDAKQSLSDASVRRATGLALTGLVCVFSGFYGFRLLGFDLLVPRANLQWNEGASIRAWATVFGLAGLSIYSAARVLRVPEALEQASVTGGNLLLIAITILFVIELIGGLPTHMKCFLWLLLVPLRTLLGLSSGAAAQVLVLFVLLLFSAATISGRIPWAGLLLGAVALGVVRPLMQPFRSMSAQAPTEQESEFGRIELLGQLAMNVEKMPVPYNVLFQFTLKRLAHITSFAEVARDTPDHVPYWEGKTYLPLMFKPVPRLIFPGKPEEHAGQDFGHRYGFLDQDDVHTAYNLPQVIELYVNFGPAGVVLGMFIIGAIYQTVQRIFVHPQMGLGATVCAIYLLSSFLQMESNASLVFGGVMENLVFIVIVDQVIVAGGLISDSFRTPPAQ